MQVVVKTQVFKEKMMSLLRGVSKVNVNFKVVGKYLYPQVSNIEVTEEKMPVIEVRDFTDEDVTVLIDKSIELLQETEEYTILDFSNGILTIRQSTFCYNASKQPEIRVDLDCRDKDFTEKFNCTDFTRVVNESKCLDEVAKNLGNNFANINIYNGRAYVTYSNTLFHSECDLPNMRLTAETARRVQKSVDGKVGSLYRLHENTRSLEIKVNEDRVVVIPTMNCSIREAQDAKELESAMKLVCKINMTTIKGVIDVVGRVYPKLMLNVGVCEDTFRIVVDNVNNKLDIGSKKTPIVMCVMSTAQLVLIGKLMSGDIEVWRGENKLCLKAKTYGRTLVLAGTLY